MKTIVERSILEPLISLTYLPNIALHVAQVRHFFVVLWHRADVQADNFCVGEAHGKEVGHGARSAADIEDPLGVVYCGVERLVVHQSKQAFRSGGRSH